MVIRHRYSNCHKYLGKILQDFTRNILAQIEIQHDPKESVGWIDSQHNISFHFDNNGKFDLEENAKDVSDWFVLREKDTRKQNHMFVNWTFL